MEGVFAGARAALRRRTRRDLRDAGVRAAGELEARPRSAPWLHVLAIFGPTASGKSAVAQEVARLIPAELCLRRCDAGLPRAAAS